MYKFWKNLNAILGLSSYWVLVLFQKSWYNFIPLTYYSNGQFLFFPTLLLVLLLLQGNNKKIYKGALYNICWRPYNQALTVTLVLESFSLWRICIASSSPTWLWTHVGLTDSIPAFRAFLLWAVRAGVEFKLASAFLHDDCASCHCCTILGECHSICTLHSHIWTCLLVGLAVALLWSSMFWNNPPPSTPYKVLLPGLREWTQRRLLSLLSCSCFNQWAFKYLKYLLS